MSAEIRVKLMAYNSVTVMNICPYVVRCVVCKEIYLEIANSIQDHRHRHVHGHRYGSGRVLCQRGIPPIPCL
jgi:hypothetical protein